MSNKRLELFPKEKHQTPQTIKEFIEPRMPLITPTKSEKPFSDAAKNFQSKVKKFTLPKKATLHKVPQRKPVFPPMRSRLTQNIRTTSISHIEGSKKESDEDVEMHHDNVLYMAVKGLAAEEPTSNKGMRKNSSQLSLSSMNSSMSRMSKGFWPSSKLGGSQRSSFNSKMDFVKYTKSGSYKNQDMTIF